MHPAVAEHFGPRTPRAKVLTACLLLATAIALTDHYVVADFSLGILYIVPLLVSAAFLTRWQVLIAAVGATILREQFGPTPWSNGAPERVAIGLLAFAGAGLFVTEVIRRRQFEAESLKRIASEATLRRETEEEERVLLQGSPAAILTIHPDGRIGLANDAARRMLGFGSDSPEGQPIARYIPMLSDILKSKRGAGLVRTMVEGSGRRRNGDMFLVQMWLSSYETSAGMKLAAVFSDISEQLRDREELGLRQLLTNSRIIVGAVSHEIRNLAAAGAVLHENMGKSTGGQHKDFQALGRIIDALRKLSSTDVPAATSDTLVGVDLEALLQELHIILDSSFQDSGVALKWEIAEGLPRVRADRSGLLQVFLNLAQNSQRALKGRPDARVMVSAYQLGPSVVVRFADNGPGLSSEDGLFQPFQPGATSTGLGLYVSRAIVRTCGGELQYARESSGGRFIIELPAIASMQAGDLGLGTFSPSSKSAPGSQSFLWTFPECPVRIHVNFQFIERLRKEVLELAPADREVGGLLIGNELSPNGDIEVSDYFQLALGSESTKNFVVCSDSLTWPIRSGRAADRRVIGFYRTHLEQRIQLRAEDLECVRSKFNHPMNVFLVIRPHDGQASAAFFFWQDGSVVGGLTFPFSNTELRSPSWNTPGGRITEGERAAQSVSSRPR